MISNFDSQLNSWACKDVIDFPRQDQARRRNDNHDHRHKHDKHGNLDCRHNNHRLTSEEKKRRKQHFYFIIECKFSNLPMQLNRVERWILFPFVKSDCWGVVLDVEGESVVDSVFRSGLAPWHSASSCDLQVLVKRSKNKFLGQIRCSKWPSTHWTYCEQTVGSAKRIWLEKFVGQEFWPRYVNRKIRVQFFVFQLTFGHFMRPRTTFQTCKKRTYKLTNYEKKSKKLLRGLQTRPDAQSNDSLWLFIPKWIFF